MGERIMKKMLDHEIPSSHYDNYRPSWLGGLELDRYYPELRTAFEYQGHQHDQYIFTLYENHADFLRQVENDLRKKTILEKKRINLIEIRTKELNINTIRKILEDHLLFQNQTNAETSYTKDFSLKKLLDQSDKYRKGIPIYQRKKMKQYFEQIGLHLLSYSYFQQTFSAIDMPYLSEKERIVYGILKTHTLLNGEVRFTSSQLKRLYSFIEEQDIQALVLHRLIEYRLDFGLIRFARSDETDECQ
jgi:hypothetical protein